MLQEALLQIKPLEIIVITVVMFMLCLVLQGYWNERKLDKLGARAPKIRSSWPLGIDFIYRYAVASAENREVAFFASCLDIRNHEQHTQSRTPPHNIKSPELVHPCLTAELASGISGRLVLTADPDNIKALLSDVNAYGKGKNFHSIWKDFIGDSIFAIDGELWERTRGKMKPIFYKENVVDTSIFEGHITHLTRLLGESHWSSDFHDVFLRYTLDVATDFLFGEGTDSLIHPESRVAEAFRNVLQIQSDLDNMDEFSWLMPRTKFRKEIKVLDDFVYPYIHRSLALSDQELETKIAARDNLLNSLTRHTRDAKFLRDQMVTILLAARDTTAATMSFLFFELNRNPTVLRMLREEISERLGTGSTATVPTAKDLRGMKLLNAVINETLRLYPPVPLNFRSALKDVQLPTGGGPDGLQPVGILKDTKIIYSIGCLQKNSDLYPLGSEPLKWKPGRWLDGSWTPDLWHFLPFHHGKRACPGQKMAQVEIAYTMTRILQQFTGWKILGWNVTERDRDIKCKIAVTMTPAEELRYKFLT